MNIVLIGMPGCGKSTVGVLLAKSLMYDFIDTDLIIQRKEGKALCEIINTQGLEEFKRIENEVLCDLQAENTVIATGGSAVYCDEGMKALKKNGKVIYLKVTPEEIKNRLKDIKTRGIAMKEGTTIDDLYKQRAPLYEKWADKIIECDGGSVEENIEKLLSERYAF